MVTASTSNTFVTTKSEETFAEAKVCVFDSSARDARRLGAVLGSYMWVVKIR